MSPPGRPKGEYRRAEPEGTPVSPHGRPKGEFPLGGMAHSAKGAAVNPHGHLNGELPLAGTDPSLRKGQP
jgi:16S rRNA (guanine527-N7)-methyltransferase